MVLGTRLVPSHRPVFVLLYYCLGCLEVRGLSPWLHEEELWSKHHSRLCYSNWLQKLGWSVCVCVCVCGCECGEFPCVICVCGCMCACVCVCVCVCMCVCVWHLGCLHACNGSMTRYFARGQNVSCLENKPLATLDSKYLGSINRSTSLLTNLIKLQANLWLPLVRPPLDHRRYPNHSRVGWHHVGECTYHCYAPPSQVGGEWGFWIGFDPGSMHFGRAIFLIFLLHIRTYA